MTLSLVRCFQVINIIEHITKDRVIRKVPLSLRVINITEHLTKDRVIRKVPLSLKVINIIEHLNVRPYPW
jgi:hypothetical protein